uniref:Sulfotransferase n=1 Tax=Branchiostoma floridae TaxID=7739 RepID=C3ZH40_BRAFL|eukprot:XP_002592176.1 hypothetical protein BRAFLDRAFT_88100 [Branchiostoma floridae]
MTYPYYDYKGVLFPDIISRETLDVIPDYPVRDDDIFILSYPKSVKVIVVLRNPKDVVVSLYHYDKMMDMEFGSGDLESLESWDAYATNFLEGTCQFGDIYDHALGWWQMKNDRHFLFLKYEDMKKDLRSAVSDIAVFLDTSLDQATVDSIAESCTFNALKTAWGNSDHPMKKHLCRKGAVLT